MCFLSVGLNTSASALQRSNLTNQAALPMFLFFSCSATEKPLRWFGGCHDRLFEGITQYCGMWKLVIFFSLGPKTLA
jgi:hypothetical protein